MIFFHSTRNELIKIALKPRSYLGLAAITGLVGIILFALVADGMTVISFVTASFEQTLRFEGKVLNGNLVAFIILQMLIVQIPLLVALVTGDLISGEAAMGTLRMLMTKPITRTQLLMSKFLAGGIYTFLIVLCLGFMAVGIGRYLFGPGDLMVLNSDGLVILQEGDTIINALDVPVFDPISPLLFTTHMAAWRSFFEDPVPWQQIKQSSLVLIVHNILFIGISIFTFNRKDITV